MASQAEVVWGVGVGLDGEILVIVEGHVVFVVVIGVGCEGAYAPHDFGPNWVTLSSKLFQNHRFVSVVYTPGFDVFFSEEIIIIFHRN